MPGLWWGVYPEADPSQALLGVLGAPELPHLGRAVPRPVHAVTPLERWRWVIELPNLDPTERALLHAIAFNDAGPGHCFASKETLARQVGASLATVKRALSRLIAKKAISVVGEPSRGRHANAYMINIEPAQTEPVQSELVQIEPAHPDQATGSDCAGNRLNLIAPIREPGNEPGNEPGSGGLDAHAKANGKTLDNPDSGELTAGGRKRDKSRREPFSTDFESAWAIYPKRDGSNPKGEAFSAWNARLREGHTAEEMLQGVRRYHSWCDARGKTGTETVMQAKRFFGPGKEFTGPWPIAAPKSPKQEIHRAPEP